MSMAGDAQLESGTFFFASVPLPGPCPGSWLGMLPAALGFRTVQEQSLCPGVIHHPLLTLPHQEASSVTGLRQDAPPGTGLWDQLNGTELFLRNLLISVSYLETPNLSDWSGFAKRRKASKLHENDPQPLIPSQCGT